MWCISAHNVDFFAEYLDSQHLGLPSDTCCSSRHSLTYRNCWEEKIWKRLFTRRSIYMYKKRAARKATTTRNFKESAVTYCFPKRQRTDWSKSQSDPPPRHRAEEFAEEEEEGNRLPISKDSWIDRGVAKRCNDSHSLGGKLAARYLRCYGSHRTGSLFLKCCGVSAFIKSLIQHR